MHGKHAAAASDGMPGCFVAEADLCCDVSEIAATDLQGTMNSFGIGDTFANIVSGDKMVAPYLLRLIFRMRRIHTVSGGEGQRPRCFCCDCFSGCAEFTGFAGPRSCYQCPGGHWQHSFQRLALLSNSWQ